MQSKDLFKKIPYDQHKAKVLFVEKVNREVDIFEIKTFSHLGKPVETEMSQQLIFLRPAEKSKKEHPQHQRGVVGLYV